MNTNQSLTICPVCNKQVKPGHFACIHAGKIGSISSPAKTAACKRNINKRWEGHNKKKAAEEKDIKKNIVSYYKKHFRPI